jgi:hypothetical protein
MVLYNPITSRRRKRPVKNTSWQYRYQQQQEQNDNNNSTVVSSIFPQDLDRSKAPIFAGKFYFEVAPSDDQEEVAMAGLLLLWKQKLNSSF